MPVDHAMLTVPNVAKWADWLAREADKSNGVMLTIVKKGFTKPTSLTYEEARDEALCYGWIDSTGHKVDDGTYVRRFTPRRPKSVWSKYNVELVGRFTEEGRMQPRGLLEVEKAKADGRWDAAYSQASMEPPADLSAAIAAVPEAQAQWNILTKTNKFAICFRLAALKTEAGRQKRLQAFVDMLARGETLHPQKQKRPEMKPEGRVISKPAKERAPAKVSSTLVRQSQFPRRRSQRITDKATKGN